MLYEVITRSYKMLCLELHLSDLDYDKVELEYRKLAEELGVKASACDMVGFDLERASCRLVVSQVDRIRSVNFSLLSL